MKHLSLLLFSSIINRIKAIEDTKKLSKLYVNLTRFYRVNKECRFFNLKGYFSFPNFSISQKISKLFMIYNEKPLRPTG